MTSKHTPPPWFVHDFRGASNEPSVHDITVSCDHPATLTVCYMGKALHGTEEEALANANLIAAAPELYEALEESQAELECVYDELRKHQAPKISGAFLRLMNQNRAALAKAKGFSDENKTPDGVGENNE